MVHATVTALLALPVVASAVPAHAAIIAVDASKQTAGNPKFWVAAVGTGTATLTLRSDLQTHYKIANREIGSQRVRGHGVLSDGIGIYKGPGSYDWSKFDTYLQAIVSAGMRPIMELSFMPKALAKSGNDKDVPKDYATYKMFIQAVVQHCVDKYGADDVAKWYWEVWNEYDYAGFWNGTASDYYTLYDNAVDGATAVLPNIQIGGPASTEPGKVGAFLKHCKSANKRVTFASSHSYPGGNGSSPANAASLVNDNNSRVSGITGAGYTTAEVKSFNTEWNSSYSGQGGTGTGDALTSMDNHWNAPFILKAAKLLSDKNTGDTPPLEVFSYWVVSDVFDENSGPIGSYIDTQGGTLPFGKVFGMMTFQGMRKAAFNAFKMLNYMGPKRLMSSGGTGSDGVDAMATSSASGDELQLLVYNTYATLNTSGSDSVTINVSNLPAALANKELFVTHFRVDETHSNPYSVWVSQGNPKKPTEAQWQAMKKQQHLALLQDVAKMAVTTSFTTTFTLPKQAGSLILLGTKRPVTGRNALVEIEGEDYDGISSETSPAKEDSADSSTLGQSLAAKAGDWAFYNVVDFGDVGVTSAQLRVNAQTATSLELHADTATGPLIGTCAIAATTGWANQTCTITPQTGVHTLYVTFTGAVRLNWMKFIQEGGNPGTGGASGQTGGSGGGGSTGTGGGVATTGGKSGSGGGSTGTGGTISGSGGDNNNTGGSSSGDTGGSGPATGGAGTTPTSSGGCSCDASGSGGTWGLLTLAGLGTAMMSRVRRRRARSDS